MNNTVIGAILLLLSFPLFSQTPISGTINNYTKVTDIDPCEARMSVTGSTFFNVGDQVLVIQMQGATINESNSSSYGDITELGSAGLFERNEIADIVGNDIFLKFSLLNSYDVNGAVQLVSIPVYDDVIVEETLATFPWNGQMGGVLVLEVTNTIILDANIDVSGQGFRGGEVNSLESDCNFLTNADDYHYSFSNWRGAPKGEGIAAPISGKEQGRGAQANGGGGGNDHNSGGGGGGNLTQGGDGGKQSVGGLGCDGDYPGKGGKPLDEPPQRIFFGGGGGAGHADDVGAGSNGGNGGGIVILIAGEVIGNGYSIISNGLTANDGLAAGDGQGGGGAGGTLLLDVEVFTGGLTIEAKGGGGGDANNPSNRCFGPGGGGSGGRLICSQVIPTTNLQGGEPGVNVNSSSECSSDPSNGADAGEEGLQIDFEGIPMSFQEVEEVAILEQPVPMTACEEIQVSFEFLMEGEGLGYEWQVNDGSGWQDVQPSATVTGVTTYSLTLFEPTVNMDGWQYRCIVTGPCTDDIISNAATLTVIEAPIPDFSFSSLGGGAVEFQNLSQNATGYAWDFGDNQTSMEENPIHTYNDFGTYTVVLTVFSDCGEMTISEDIPVSAPPSGAFSMDADEGCAPLVVQFLNESSANVESWEWQFPGGAPAASFDENPSVIYTTAGSFDVTLIVSNTEGSDTVTMESVVQVDDVPEVDFIADVNLLTVQFANTSQNATGGYLWDFGDNQTSTDVSPEHIYSDDGYFEVTLTAFNDCGESSVTQTVATGQFPLAAFSTDYLGNCAPLQVQFSDQSSGSNLTNWAWEFEGGSPAVSSVANPVVTYSEPGSYDVKLTVTNAFGDHTSELENFVVVDALPEVDFSFSVNELEAAFFNSSTDGLNYLWDFGDGNNSTEDSPVHVYDAGGLYTVTLTVSNGSCGSSYSQLVWIDVASATGETIGGLPIRIFPNPASEFLGLEMDGQLHSALNLMVFDLSGKIWRSLNISNPEHQIDLSGMPAGFYILEVKIGEERKHLKFVKD